MWKINKNNNGNYNNSNNNNNNNNDDDDDDSNNVYTIKNIKYVIGFKRAYLSRKRREITWVSNYRCPIWTLSNRTPVIDTHVILTSITRALMASLPMFSTVFQNLGKALRTFSLKRTS